MCVCVYVTVLDCVCVCVCAGVCVRVSVTASPHLQHVSRAGAAVCVLVPAVHSDGLKAPLQLPQRRFLRPELVIWPVILPHVQVVVTARDELVVAVVEELDAEGEVGVGGAATDGCA